VGERISAEIEIMPEGAEKFACGGCQRQLTWKKDFVGRRIKCKFCGHSMAIPPHPLGAEPEPEPVEEELYALSDLANDARSAAAKLPPTIVQAVASPIAMPAGAGPSHPAIPLAYQRAPTARELARSSSDVFIHKKRDIQVPIALLIIGAALYLGYYAIHYHLGGLAILATGIGLIILAMLQTGILFGFALVIASPLGVSFGGIGTALLKFAAIALFCDGIVTWVDGLFATWTGGLGGGGILGFGAIQLPITLGVYWVTLTYLFSMDPGDSWLVVVILVIFSIILRVLLIVLLLRLILSFGGVAASSVAIPSTGGGTVATNPLIDQVNRAKAQNVLHEARKYVADNGRSAESATVNGWYDAGAKNVWFETDRDINGKGNAFEMVVELPDDQTARAKCYDVAKKYFNDNGESFEAKSLQDNGDPYLLVPLP
jgi:DNA-directed RNA polymerase subunit RPC12/RpoP